MSKSPIALGKLERLDPRHAWKHEAHDFTPWLAGNLEMLGDALGFDLDLVATERSVGPFSADILARDLGTGHTVVVENQLEPTDHSHLGQIITYAAGLDANVIVWVSREVREEHREALDWLNRGLEADISFFAVVLELLQINNSPPAPNFRVVASPNDWSREASRSGKAPGDGELTARQQRYQNYFQQLIDELREQHHFTNARRGQPQNWYSFTAGVTGFQYGHSFASGGRVRVEIYIDFKDGETNTQAFNRLLEKREHLESGFGEQLEWEDLEGRRAHRIGIYREGSIEDTDDALEAYRNWAIERLLRFKRVFGSELQAIAARIG